MVWQGSPRREGRPGVLIDEGLVATGDGAYRIERCEFPDEPSSRPVLRKGSQARRLE
jgi:hypothetical protein